MLKTVKKIRYFEGLRVLWSIAAGTPMHRVEARSCPVIGEASPASWETASMNRCDVTHRSFRVSGGVLHAPHARSGRTRWVSPSPEFHGIGRVRVRAERSSRDGDRLREAAACALQRMFSSERSTGRWGLVNEETA
jgi:hypothetical protein